MRIVSGPQVTVAVVSRQTGSPLAGVTVTVNQTVYTDVELTAAATTFTTDGSGVVTFYAAPGSYTFTTSSTVAAAIEPVEVLGGEEGIATAGLVGKLSGVFAPLPTGTAAVGRVPTVTATSPLALDWETPAGGTATYSVVTGADPTGVADSTTAIQTALTAATGTVFLPAGTYSITHISIPDGVTLLGTSSRRYSGTTVGGSRLVCNTSGQTTAVVTLNVRASLRNVTCVGISSSHDVVALAGTSPTVQGCTITGGNSGIQGNPSGTYSSGAMIVGNNIYSNSASGILNVVDSLVQNNWISANVTGFNGQAGANDNVIVGNKIEFNSNVNISLVSCLNTTILGNVIDRANNEGIRLDTCTAVLVTGNVIRRNGATTADGTRNCHVRLNNCTACQVFGNTTAHGKDDAGTGNDTPTNVVYTISNTDCRTANNGIGCTGSVLNNAGSNVRTAHDGDPEHVAASAAAYTTLYDPSVATIHRVTLDANWTPTFPTANRGQSFTLVLVQDATGSRTVTWPGTVKWPAGTAPVLSTGATKADYLTFTCTDGTNWDGFLAGKDLR